MTCGPYRPISLITYTTRLSSIYPQAIVEIDSDGGLQPALHLDATLAGELHEPRRLRCVLRTSGSSQVMFSDSVEIAPHIAQNNGSSSHELLLPDLLHWELKDKVALWWPTGYGEQTLYDLDVTLLSTVRPAMTVTGIL